MDDLEIDREIEVQYTQIKLSPGELLEIFPEAKEVIRTKIREWQEQQEKIINREIRPFLKSLKKEVKDEFTAWFIEKVFEIFYVGDRLIQTIKQMERLKRLEIIVNGFKVSGENFMLEIERARNIPIVDIVYSLNLSPIRRSGKNFSCICPFHPDRNPSMYIYPETNSFYCFGCNTGGDVITFIEKYYGFSFKQAVMYLIKGG